jgi:hypothetical protein
MQAGIAGICVNRHGEEDNMGNVQLRVLLLVISTMVLSGCAGHKSPWEQAQTVNTIEAYQDFLAQHPQGEFADKARARIQELRYRRALAENTIEACEDFIHIYLEGEFVDSIRVQLEQLYYLRAISEDDSKIYRNYLRCFPYGQRAGEIRERVEKLDLAAARSANTVEALEEFLDRYPNSEAAGEIRSRLQNLYVKINRKVLVPWTTFADCVLSVRRRLNNNLRLTINRPDGKTPFYIISPLERNGAILLGSNQPSEASVSALTGELRQNRPDEQFYTVLGVGTYLKMDADDWVEICGVTFKSGAVKIVDQGLEFQSGTIFRDIDIRPVRDTRLGVVQQE